MLLLSPPPPHLSDNAQDPNNPSVLDGHYFREKAWSEAVKRPKDKVGPKQVAQPERIDVSDRIENIKRANVSAASRYNERVNTDTRHRAFELGGYETETWIDPTR
jgi:hypothetical protein